MSPMIIQPQSSPKKTPTVKQKSYTLSSPISPLHLSTVFQQMGTMAQANIPLLEIMKTLSTHAPTKKLQQIFTHAYELMQKGHSLYDAFLPYEKNLGTTTLSMIALAEATGQIPQALKTLSTLTHGYHIQQQKLFKALHTPLITLAGMMVAMITLVSLVIPQFESLFASRGAVLPTMTIVLIFVAHFFQQWGFWLLLMIVFSFSLFSLMIHKSPSLCAKKDSILLMIPMVGKIVTLASLSRFTTVLSHVTQSGIPFNKALPIALQGIDNKALKSKLETIISSLSKGEKLTTSFSATKLFDPISLSFIAAAENSGFFEELLIPMSSYMSDLFDHYTEKIIKWVEPVLIVCMGGMVLVLALGVFMPMWGLTHSLH